MLATMCEEIITMSSCYGAQCLVNSYVWVGRLHLVQSSQSLQFHLHLTKHKLCLSRGI